MQAKKLQAAALSTQSVYIEDVFSTYLYTGTGTTAGSTQTITNGIDLAGEGGMVWIKDRGVKDHFLFDTNRGPWKYLRSNTTDAESGVNEDALSAFNSNGFTLTGDNNVTQNGQTYASWTFRKQPKFFDVVTWTGNNIAGRNIPHSLASVPGCIIVKGYNLGINWYVYHRGADAGNPAEYKRAYLNSTAAFSNTSAAWNDTAPTSTNFTVGTDLNNSNYTYVAYLFAHDAGGFGEDGSENVISCGSYTGNGLNDGPEVNLGWEPQWLLLKRTDDIDNWWMQDNMRGMPAHGLAGKFFYANTTGAEQSGVVAAPQATGFKLWNGGFNRSGGTYIYIAIRRGPMKTPTTGTSVFGLNARTGTGANATVTGGAGVTDLAIIKKRGSVTDWVWVPRLLNTSYRSSNNTSAEVAAGTTILQANPWDVMDGVKVGTTSTLTNASGNTFINYLLDRAPGFMDVVCYQGNGTTNRTVAHNLGVPPEMMIVFGRGGGPVYVYHQSYGSQAFAYLNGFAAWETSGAIATTIWSATTPDSTSFFLGNASNANGNGENYTNYLFATLPGVSKVFSYTGNGSSQTINCGFTGGARFVLIKRSNSTGDWYVWDSARGIVAGNDPHLSLNTDVAEVTTDDSVDTDSTGFIVNQLAATNINVNAATYIGLAIA